MVKVVGNFEVKDWTHWKKMFDEHSGPREAAGIKTIYVGHELENPNKVHIVMETPAAETMQKFMQNEENAKVIEKSGHCLLYTSPSPRDLSTSRMPSSA